MKLLTLLSLILFSASSSVHASGIWIEGLYGQSSTPMTELNQYRKGFLWNNSTASEGDLHNLNYAGASLGARFLFHTILSFRYEQRVQRLKGKDVPGTGYSVSDGFVYEPLYLMLELPMFIGNWTLTVGGGAGYALTYQYHQKLAGSQGEDVIWQGHPIGTRARVSLGYRFFRHVSLFAEGIYENVKSELTAYKDYQTTAYGQGIQMGQYLQDGSGKKTVADLSGLSYGLGLRFMF